MKRKFLGLVGMLFFALACGLIAPTTSAQPGVGTIVAETLQALAPTPIAIEPTQVPPAEAPTQTTQASGIPINFENASIMIPNGLASGATGENVAAVPADGGAPWGVGPAYIKFILSSYNLQGTMWQPEIHIYPAEEFRMVDPAVGEMMDKLNSILANPSGPLPDNLPFLPFVNAGQVFHAQMQVVNFQNGSGIRYLTQFDQAPLPINNQEMFYTYQGLSQDGKYFISATFPVSAAFLPTDGSQNSPTPADGVPMDWVNFDNYPIYMDSVTQKINTTDPNVFMPSLPMLDALIQSITVN